MEKESSVRSGLTVAEAEKRLKEFGPNEIPEKKTNPIIRFLGYFWGPIPWMIEVAVVLSAYLAHWDDFGVIFALLLVNSVVGFWQEYKADNAIELLKQRLALKAKVLRDGKWSEIPARELVPDDVVRVRLGDVAPADVKLVEGEYLLVDQSALTGESLPVEKHVSDVTYAGSIIRQGEMDGIVVGTGINSYFGRTAKLVEEAKSRSHFQKTVINIGNYLIILASVLVAVIFLAAVFRHESILNTAQFALVLLVAAIPVAMPAVLTVTMAVGAVALAKKDAIVSKLVSIEEMAGMDILCSDKTGTITKNELKVSQLETFSGFTHEDALLFASLASRQEDNDPIDMAILDEAGASPSTTEAISHFKIVKFVPFDPVSKRTEATVEDKSGTQFKVTKGARAIIDAIKESRKIFQRMNNYAIYRIAETTRILIFLTLAILAFSTPPITALMLVLLAMLNDLPIMMIAYDNAKVSGSPARWEMRKVLMIATVLGVAGVFSSFLLLAIGREVLHLNAATLQTLIFLKLAVAGHMTLYLARTGEQHFWTRPFPSYKLFLTTEVTQLVATFLAAYGILVQPIGWGLAGLVWGYALLFFVVNDFVKVKASEIFNHNNLPINKAACLVKRDSQVSQSISESDKT